MHNYVEFEKFPNALKITLLPLGREFLQEKIDDEGKDALSPDDVVLELFEDQLCNGWETIAPEEVGALTDGLLITDEGERDDHGKLTKCGKVFWDDNYQVRSLAMTLYQTGTANMRASE